MKKIAPYLVIVAGFCWGIIGIFTRQLSNYGLDAIQITALRSLTATITLFFLIATTDKRNFKIALRDLWYFLGTGLCSIVFFNVCYFYTLEHATMAFASVLLYTAPAIVILLSALLYRERITVHKIIALFLSMAGCIISTGIIGSGSEKVNFVLVLTGLGAGFGYALYSIFGAAAMKKYRPITVTFYTFLIAFAGIVSFAKPVAIIKLVSQQPKVILWAFLLGIISTVIPFVAYTKALEHMENGKAAIMAFSEPMVAAVCGILVFRESITVSNLLGIGCMFFGIILLNIRIRKDSDKAVESKMKELQKERV